MHKLQFLVSLTTNDNDYQLEQARAADLAAKKCNVDVQVVYANNDAIKQSSQILNAVQAVQMPSSSSLSGEQLCPRWPAPR
jgi:ABC-type sugar transport system substrate-binding protein